MSGNLDALYRGLDEAQRSVDSALTDLQDVEAETAGWVASGVDQASEIERTAAEAVSVVDRLLDLLVGASGAVPSTGGRS